VTIDAPDAVVLRTRGRPVRSVGPSIRALIADLGATMRRARGVGLAAPQIGVPLRVFVAASGTGTIALVNPRLRRRWGSQVGPEGCLSIPGVFHDVWRSLGVEVEAQTATGRRVRVRAVGLLARVLQHEMDHLNGILFLDRLSGGRFRAVGRASSVPRRIPVPRVRTRARARPGA